MTDDFGTDELAAPSVARSSIYSSRSDTFERDYPSRGLPSWLISFVLHAFLLLLLFWAFRVVTRGAVEESSRSGGILLVESKDESTEYLSENDFAAESFDDDRQEVAMDAALPAELEKPFELPGLPSDPLAHGIGRSVMESIPSLGDLTSNATEGGQVAGGKMTTEVFGIQGTGSKFVYVFDRSASMNGYDKRPLLAAKQQLLASLATLSEAQQFQIVFYNDQPQGFGETPTLLFADERNLQQGAAYVNSIQASGGTDHMSALKIALALRPDVVFLLTDAEGGFSSAELGLIREWNVSGAVINAIEFGVGPSSGRNDQSLERLAAAHRGQYVYKNIGTLRIK